MIKGVGYSEMQKLQAELEGVNPFKTELQADYENVHDS